MLALEKPLSPNGFSFQVGNLGPRIAFVAPLLCLSLACPRLAADGQNRDSLGLGGYPPILDGFQCANAGLPGAMAARLYVVPLFCRCTGSWSRVLGFSAFYLCRVRARRHA